MPTIRARSAEWSGWTVESEKNDGSLSVIRVALPRRTLCACPDCGEPARVKDYIPRTWRAPDTGGLRTNLYARVPRVSCPRHGVKQVDVPWARRGSGFTIAFEAQIHLVAWRMGPSRAAELLRIPRSRAHRLKGRHIFDFPWGRARVALPDTPEFLKELTLAVGGLMLARALSENPPPLKESVRSKLVAFLGPRSAELLDSLEFHKGIKGPLDDLRTTSLADGIMCAHCGAFRDLDSHLFRRPKDSVMDALETKLSKSIPRDARNLRDYFRSIDLESLRKLIGRREKLARRVPKRRRRWYCPACRERGFSKAAASRAYRDRERVKKSEGR